MSDFVVTELIKKRKNGLPHSQEELEFIVSNFVSGTIPDYQMSAWLMAVCFNELSLEETALLTKIMKDSGTTINFPKDVFVVDKHSTGGIGDKTTMILGPIVAACGVPVASLAGRGLGHTGGTLDKLESIEGLEVYIPTEAFVENVLKCNLSIVGQTNDICPADKKIYALRDVTGTVDSFSLICASIMSKKLAEGIGALTLDVKYGSGAFMKTVEDATKLASWLKKIGELNGLMVHALISNMNEPLGRFAGNALEINECIEILNNKTLTENGHDFYSDTRELSLQLSAHMIFLAQKATSVDLAYKMAEEALTSGAALNKFYEMCELQGAKAPFNLPEAKIKFKVNSPFSGFITGIDTEQVGYAAINLKAGRLKSDDIIDHATGVEWHFRLNDSVKEGDKLFTLHANDDSLVNKAAQRLLDSLNFTESKMPAHKLIAKILM